MNRSESDPQQQAETVEHLLGIVVENREERCAQLRDHARQHASKIVQQAHTKSRARMHRHVSALREKRSQRVSSAFARNQTLLRQQHQKADRAVADMAWPLLRDAMLALWNSTESRRRWLDGVITSAAARLLHTDVHVEHPTAMSEHERSWLKKQIDISGKEAELQGCEDIEAGVRIIAQGTVIDATLDGLLKQKTTIEAKLIAQIKRAGGHHD
ncbi:MAG: hypothetical protein HKP12_03825 [Gammaproteobacteria bacterium]|nr:hypothetical protein [Gammaproteobacteria bacterium]